VGTRAEGAKVNHSRNGGGAGCGNHVSRALLMNASEGLIPSFVDDSNGVNDRLGLVKSTAQGVRLSDVGSKKFDSLRKF
jgi:hypothetical protein